MDINRKIELGIIAGAINVILLLTFLFSVNGYWQDRMAKKNQEILAVRQQNEQLKAEVYWYGVQKPPVYVEPLDRAWMQWISSPVGYRVDPMGGEETFFHKGIDIAAPIGTPVRVMADGVIIAHWVPPDGVYWKGHPIFGGYVIVDHGNGLFSMYGHLSVTYIHEMNHVKAGQIIGLVGDTGRATGPHLHWEICINPLRYIREVL